jgi:hypothetical protein
VALQQVVCVLGRTCCEFKLVPLLVQNVYIRLEPCWLIGRFALSAGC